MKCHSHLLLKFYIHAWVAHFLLGASGGGDGLLTRGAVGISGILWAPLP